jgi:hypothetical protein
MNEYVLSAICITALALGVGYEATHRAYQPVPVAPCPTVTVAAAPPTIEIEQTIYVPVPAPAPQVETPDTEVTPQDDSDPVFEHRTPIITEALREPLTYAMNQ